MNLLIVAAAVACVVAAFALSAPAGLIGVAVLLVQLAHVRSANARGGDLP